MRDRKQIMPFLGLNTAIDPRLLLDGEAQDLNNVTLVDGTLKPRYGFSELKAAQSNFNAVYGFQYHQGYTSGNVFQNLYMCFEDISGTVKPFAKYGSPGAVTVQEIRKPGAVSLSLDDSLWQSLSWQSQIYFFNPNDTNPLWRFTIADWSTATAVAVPTTPTVAPTLTIYKSHAKNNTTHGYDSVRWATATGCAVDGTGATAISVTANQARLTIDPNPGEFVSCSVTLALDGQTLARGPANNISTSSISTSINWFDADRFGISLSANRINVDPLNAATKVTFINADGTPIPYAATILEVTGKTDSLNAAGTDCTFWIGFENKTRSDWDNIAKIQIDFMVRGDWSATGVSGDNYLYINPITVGGVRVDPLDAKDTDEIEIFYTYYFSSADFESGPSPSVSIPVSMLRGTGPTKAASLGVLPKITTTASADANVDQIRIYAKYKGSELLRLTTQNDSPDAPTATPTTGPSWFYNVEWAVALQQTKWKATPFTFTGITCATQHGGGVLWGYQGGASNLKFSAVGNPLRLASDADDPNDPTRGATYQMAFDAADSPMGVHSLGYAVIALGDKGVYTSLGERAVEMSPFMPVPGAQGVAGMRTHCLIQDDNGSMGVAYLSKHGDQVCYVGVDRSGAAVVEDLTRALGRGHIYNFLLAGQSLSDWENCWLGYDVNRKALWVVHGTRAMVLREPNKVGGERYWEHYTYTIANSGTIKFGAFGNARADLRWMRSTGVMDQVERSAGDARVANYYTTDDGTAISNIYWTSKTFASFQRTRLDRVEVWRDTESETPTVTAYCDRQSSGVAKTVPASTKGVRFSPLQTGFEHKFKIALTAASSPVRRFVFDLLGPLSDRRTS